MTQLQHWLTQLAEVVHVDSSWLLGFFFILVGLLGRQAVQIALNRLAGKHLPLGDIANDLLRMLDEPERWSYANNKLSRGKVEIYPKKRRVLLSQQCVSGYLHRGEKRLIFRKVKDVKKALAAAQATALRQNISNGISLARYG